MWVFQTAKVSCFQKCLETSLMLFEIFLVSERNCNHNSINMWTSYSQCGDPTVAPATFAPAMISPTTRGRVRVMIGFLVRGRVRIKIRVRVRVGVTFNVRVYRWSKCQTFSQCTFVVWLSDFSSTCEEVELSLTLYSLPPTYLAPSMSMLHSASLIDRPHTKAKKRRNCCVGVMGYWRIG